LHANFFLRKLINLLIMDTLTLEVQSRASDISASDVRRNGLVPAIFYGAKQENRILTIDYQTFRRIYEKAGGNIVLELVIDGKDKTNVLVHEIQYDPVTDKFTHVDFIYVDMNKEVTTEVPIIIIGESKAVREDGGTLMHNRPMLMVKCMAKDIPKSLEVDITPLEDFRSSIHVSDIVLPEGVITTDDEGLTIATVVAPKVEEEEAPPEEEEGVEGEEGAEGEAAEKKEGEGAEKKEGEGGKEEGKAEKKEKA
jgi:large subunit ribosomal protein L25